MKVEITNNKGQEGIGNPWYSSRIGEKFDVEEVVDEDRFREGWYWVVVPKKDNFTHYIQGRDCVAVSWGIDAAWDKPSEDWFDSCKPVSNVWIENKDFVQPVADDVLVDVKLDGVYDAYYNGTSAGVWMWKKLEHECVTHWRLHKEEKSLEDAWDEPDSIPWTEAVTCHKGEQILAGDYYKYPDTPKKIIYPKKKSVEQITADSYNQVAGTSLSEQMVVDIVRLVEALKNMEKV